ncbi:hypothetical protein P2G88_04375 [Aliiglaciecola sp. CAU 1673]|uniref:hypothetical protein n=1 Tax=Aliiglaciecola sp. CAU 1673 TaxID=3032595 RepID=UPI0023D9927F|nr:hypothetical protein [Aliiglaciecola sp. CAU 1673]MDF2177481.1 hypothetical protein [Aliiglaciecola sp. CAU 1673]
MFRKLLLVFSVLVFANANAQLQSSAFLGLAPVDSAPGIAVEVGGLHPDGTGAAIGLLTGDTLKALNGVSVRDFAHLLEQLVAINEGTKLELSVVREGKEVRLEGVAKSRPRESGQGYSVDYGQFTWKNNHIRTISYYPDTPREDKAAVMFIQGYTCDSIDYGMSPNMTLSQLLASYAQAGFSVFKMEKPGVGDSKGPLNCADYDFDTENAAFVAGLQHFSSDKRINPDNMFVFGHSLGVLHAAKIAEQGLVKGVMGYGGVLKPWFEYLQDIYTKQAVQYFGVSSKQSIANLKTVNPFLDQWLNTDKSWQHLLQDKTLNDAMRSGLIPINGESVFDRHFSFFRSLNRYDFTGMWSNSLSHALMMHGTLDIQAIDGSWATQIAALVDATPKSSGHSISFPDTDHALMRYPNKQSLLAAMRNNTYRPEEPLEHYNPEIAKASLEWMQSILTP